jgi:hypothetical protein
MAGGATGISTTIIRIELPEHIYQDYMKQADASGKDLEHVLVRRLIDCREYDLYGGKPLRLSPTERHEIERLFSRSFGTGSDLVLFLKRNFHLTVEGVKVPISGQLLSRMKDRCGQRREWKTFLAETIIKQLEHYAGMR